MKSKFKTSNQTISSLGEFGLISEMKEILGRRKDAIVSIGDDTAVLPYKKHLHQLMTADMLIDGVHFTRKIPGRWIGHKALGCSLSDIAAMGGVPRFAVVAIGVPKKTPARLIREIYRGIASLAKAFSVEVVGGDTVASRKLTVSVTALGEVKPGHLTLRSGAKPGDQIFVTGPLGGSLKSGRHAKFTPRVKEAQKLVKQFDVRAMIDISDGLLADLGHIIEQSGVGASLYLDQIPRHRGATVRNCLYDGEDFELLLTLPEKYRRKTGDLKKKFSCYHIGEAIKVKGEILAYNAENELVELGKEGYEHFKR